VVLAWCVVAFKAHQKLASLGVARSTAEFAKMKAGKGPMFKAFQKDYTFTTDLDVQAGRQRASHPALPLPDVP
jgi:hypothetical protein